MISEIKIPFNKNLFLKDDQIASDDNTIESEGEVDTDSNGNEENEETIAIFSRKKQVNEVYYSAVPIEYPKTSEAGVATAYNITGWKNPRDCWKNVS